MDRAIDDAVFILERIDANDAVFILERIDARRPTIVDTFVAKDWYKGSGRTFVPHESHPQIVTPPDETVLWRYMDFAKFVQLIDTKSLWLSRQDQFEDPLEGTLTDGELQQLKEFEESISTPFLDRYQSVSSFLIKPVFVSCWRSGPHESMAMWDLYGKGSGIVAVKTTVAL